ncbi:MAG: response regulator [Bacteroidota bacterium]|nr:response regulator [Bacteroidota bacterium]
MSNILIIDDDELQLALQRSILMDAGFTVFATADGPYGIFIYQQNDIDLVLLDIGIPSMSGLEVLREIKKVNPNATVIMVTGYPSIESSTLAVKYGAFDYIQKPFEANLFLKRIKNALQLNDDFVR